MSSWLKCCGILDQATAIYLVLWELREILLLSSTGHVALLCEFQHPKRGKGKHEWIKQEQSQKRLERSTWAVNCSNTNQLHIPCVLLSAARGLRTYRLGQTPKKWGTSVRNNTICNQNKWMEDNALISQLAQPGLLKKWRSLLSPHPTLKLVPIDLFMLSFMVFSCWQ